MEQDTKIDSNSTININDDINIDQEIHIKWFFYTFILIILFNIQKFFSNDHVLFYNQETLKIILIIILFILILWFIYYFCMNINNKLLYTKSIFNQIICYLFYVFIIIIFSKSLLNFLFITHNIKIIIKNFIDYFMKKKN